ncbi:MAG: hypothetical protein IH988_05985 [Planctomycetes bacterium]|nr:hypothetical protein [Planctomycetota bacterium]
MKTIVSVIAVALVVTMLLVLAVSPVSADCPIGSIPEWEGDVDNLWTTEGNWVDDFEPYHLNPNACLHLDGGDNICEYDTYFGNILWGITIFGEFPTLFTFNITKDICPSSFDLQDYASLDVDECVDTGTTDLSGRVKIDVAQAPSEPPGWIDCCLGIAAVEDESASLGLTGQVKFTRLTISAENADQNVGLTLDDGGTVLADEIRIKAEVHTFHTARKAGLHLKDGSIVANELLVWAGQTGDRRVSLDLDESMTVRNKTTIGEFGVGSNGGGIVAIDLPIGVTLDVGELVINGPSVVRITGIGLNDVFGQVVSSTNEEASDNTCTCLCSD